MAIAGNPTHKTSEDVSGPCDPRAFARLHRWGGEKLVREMVELFLAQVPERLEVVRRDIRTENSPEIERAAHSPKSSSAQLGARRMQMICGCVERLAARGDLGSIP